MISSGGGTSTSVTSQLLVVEKGIRREQFRPARREHDRLLAVQRTPPFLPDTRGQRKHHARLGALLGRCARQSMGDEGKVVIRARALGRPASVAAGYRRTGRRRAGHSMARRRGRPPGGDARAPPSDRADSPSTRTSPAEWVRPSSPTYPWRTTPASNATRSPGSTGASRFPRRHGC